MPELPEVAAMASFINDFAKSGPSEPPIDETESSKAPTVKRVLGKNAKKPSHDHPVVFAQCAKSTINLNPDPKAANFLPFPYFTVSAESRGKELRLTLTERIQEHQQHSSGTKATKQNLPRRRYILIQPGMSGDFVGDSKLRTHAHLWFVPGGDNTTERVQVRKGTASKTKANDDEGKGILQFVDARRFGRWSFSEVPIWGSDRGPDPVKEYEGFKRGLLQFFDCECAEEEKTVVEANASRLSRVQLARRETPVCEWMADQRYFNGVGNIYRCEILHRCQIPPLAKCGRVFFTAETKKLSKAAVGKLDREKLNLLCSMTRQVLTEALNMKFSYLNELAEGPARSRFENWLQVYGKGKNLVDSKGRTIWFHGEAGGLGSERRDDTRGRRATKGTRERRSGGGRRKASSTVAANSKKAPRVAPKKEAPSAAKRNPSKSRTRTSIRAPPAASRKRARETERD